MSAALERSMRLATMDFDKVKPTKSTHKGRKFGEWTTISEIFTGPNKYGAQTRWIWAQCSCGHEQKLSWRSLRNRLTRNCEGC